MENLSLRQWVIAGVQSGFLMALIMVAFMFVNFLIVSSYPDTFSQFESLLFTALSIFLNIPLMGFILGALLFFCCGKLSSKGRMPKCLFMSMIYTICICFISFIVSGFTFKYFFAILGSEDLVYALPLLGIGFLTTGLLFSGLYGVFFLVLIGASFGFLINYFITRMERKTGVKELQFCETSQLGSNRFDLIKAKNKSSKFLFYILIYILIFIVMCYATFLMFSYQTKPTKSKVRDATRELDIRQISTACQLYYSDVGTYEYPVYSNFGALRAGGIEIENSMYFFSDDPREGDVHYVWIDNTGEGQDQNFCVYAKLESKSADTWVVGSEKGVNDDATREPIGLGDACW